MANLRFQGHVTLRVMLPKNKNFKIGYFAYCNPAKVTKMLHFALSLTVSEKAAQDSGNHTHKSFADADA